MAESETDRDPFELLAAEFIERCRRGQHPSVDEYAGKHPEYADEIRDLFPAIAAIEHVKSADPGQSGGGPVRGGLPLERLGDFRIIRELGRGGMGIVYEAEQESLDRRVAIKVLPRPLLLGTEQLVRFQREAHTAAKLHHTNIVPIFGVGQHDGYHFIVMQYIRGVGLDAIIRELQRQLFDGGTAVRPASSKRSSSRGSESVDALTVARTLATAKVATGAGSPDSADEPVDNSTVEHASTSAVSPTGGLTTAYWRSAARIVLQAAEALEYAHRKGTLHRDVKPGNLLIDVDGAVWIADFGLAKSVDQQGVTQTGDIVGTLRYMAPEQFKGRYDARSEVYSLGLTLYELATLRPAFAETGKTTLIDAIVHGQLTAPRRYSPPIPRDLETVILKATASDPDSRYASADALADDLRCFLEDRPIQARRAKVTERLWRWSRRNPALATLTGAVAALLLAVAATSTAAYVHTHRANQRVRDALTGEQEQRRKAEMTTDLALEALDAIFAEFAPRSTLSISTEYVDSSDTQAVTVPLQPVLSKETAALLEHMLEFYLRLARQDGDTPAIQRKMAAANQRIGDIHQRLGAFEDAATAYSQALALYAELERNQPDSSDLPVEVARIHNEMGNMFVAQERGGEGRDQFLLAASTLESASPSSLASPENRFELARTYFLLGRNPRPPIPPQRRDRRRSLPQPPAMLRESPSEERLPPEAPSLARFEPGRRLRPGMAPHELHLRVDYLQDAVSILSELCSACPNVPSYRLLLARCYRELPPAFPDIFLETESDPCAQAVEILEQLVQDFPGVPEYRYELGETYAMLDGTRGPNVSDPQVVAQHMRNALRIMEELVAERPNVPAYELALARMHHKLGNELLRSDRHDEAEAAFRRAIELQSALVRRFPEIGPYAVGQVVYQNSLAELLFQQNQLQEARTLLESNVTILDGDVCQALGHAYVYDLSEHGYRLLSTVLRNLGEHELADAATERADASQQARRDIRVPPRAQPK